MPELTVMEVVYKTTDYFRQRLGPALERPRIEAEILIADALGLNRLQLHLKHDQPLSAQELSLCRERVARRAKGEPVAYITGTREFYGLPFRVRRGVLIPRPETEELVSRALGIAMKKASASDPFSWLELGCGSGCVSVSLAAELKKAGREGCGVAIDLSPVAVSTTRENHLVNGAPGQLDVIECRAENLFDIFGARRRFDVLLANPPYIKNDDPEVALDVREYEPGLALFAGASGTEAIEAWLSAAQTYVEGPTPFVFEMGHGQADWARATLTPDWGVENLEVHRDLSGRDRYLTGVLLARG